MSRRISAILLLVFQFVVFVGYVYLRMDNARIVHEPRLFGDTGDYFHNAELSVFSPDFWTDARPPVTALFWKLVGSDPEKIFTLQLFLSMLCWEALAIAVAHAVKSYWIKPIAFLVVLAFSMSRDVFMWEPFLGSESIGISLMALFLVFAILAFIEWKNWQVALLILLAFAMTLTRDTYAYLFLMTALVIVPVFWFSEYRGKAVAVAAAFIVIFAVSSQLAVIGLRPYRAILMNTSLRIYPSEEYTEYFRHHGMPVDDRLVQEARKPTTEDKFYVNKALYFDEDQQDFRDWAKGPGRGEYIKFLWFFKADVLQKVFTETAGQSFYPDVYYYTATGYHPLITDVRIAEILYPTRFGLVFFFAVNIIAAFIAAFAWREKKALWLLPILMILFTYPQAVLVWAADANDIARHSVPYNIMLRLGVWMLAFFVLDFLIWSIYLRWAASRGKELPA
jgi:hypothetical protein